MTYLTSSGARPAAVICAARSWPGARSNSPSNALFSLDGDGSPDLAVCLLPDLYVFRSDGPDAYRPSLLFQADMPELRVLRVVVGGDEVVEVGRLSDATR